MKRNPELKQSLQTKINKTIDLEQERYYAVLYEENYYTGRITNLKDDTCDIKFLQENLENKYTWPTKSDIQNVPKNNRGTCIFYGPVDIIGNDPFTVNSDIIKKIKIYQKMKSQN